MIEVIAQEDNKLYNGKILASKIYCKDNEAASDWIQICPSDVKVVEASLLKENNIQEEYPKEENEIIHDKPYQNEKGMWVYP